MLYIFKQLIKWIQFKEWFNCHCDDKHPNTVQIRQGQFLYSSAFSKCPIIFYIRN